jgi:hypothetical protein
MVFLLALAGFAAAGDVLKPGPESVPEWAQQGRFRFTRLDGGPLEVRKTTRSEWGKHFNEQQKEVLANLYSKYGDRMADLLAEANINWVWPSSAHSARSSPRNCTSAASGPRPICAR